MNLRIEDRSRVSLHGIYRLQNGGGERGALIVDLSAKGCRLLDRLHPLPVGAELTLTFGHLNPFAAKVCWQEGSFYGIEFLRPLHAMVRDHLTRTAADLRTGRRPR